MPNPKNNHPKFGVNIEVVSPTAMCMKETMNQVSPASQLSSSFSCKAKAKTVNSNAIAIIIMYWSATETTAYTNGMMLKPLFFYVTI